MKAIAAGLVLCLASVALSGCGFQPLYGQGASRPNEALAQIRLDPIPRPDPVGYLLESELERRFGGEAASSAKYGLSVRLSERRQPLAVQIDASVTRYNYFLSARYTLIDLTTGQRHNGSTSAVASYNVVSSQYATLSVERDAQERAARLVAFELETQLALFFATDAFDGERAEATEVLETPDETSETPDAEPETSGASDR